MSMLALALQEPGRLELIEASMPEEAPGEAIVKISRAGVCGTDYHAFRGKQPYFSYPRILGHELAGEVVSRGNTDFSVGDAVAIMPYVSCGACIACGCGKPNACERLRVLGVHAEGGMQPYIRVPYRQLVKTKGLSADEAVIVEPLAIGLHAVNRAGLAPGELTLVIGAGPIGLAAMKFAKLQGANVVAMDLSANRLAFASEWAQADAVVHAGEDAQERLLAATGGRLPSAVFDATGNRASMERAFDYAAHGGTVVFVSLVQGIVGFTDEEFHKKELTLHASRAATKAEFEQVIAHIRQGSIDAGAFITHRAAFEEGHLAIPKWLAAESAVIKAVLQF